MQSVESGIKQGDKELNWLASVVIGILGAVLGGWTLYGWAYMPSPWLCDYGEEETLLQNDRCTEFCTWGPVFSAVFSLGTAYRMRKMMFVDFSFGENAGYHSVKQAGIRQWESLKSSSLWQSVAQEEEGASAGWKHVGQALESAWATLFLIAVLWLLILVFLSDLEFFIIPDQLIAGLAGMSVLNSAVMSANAILANVVFANEISANTLLINLSVGAEQIGEKLFETLHAQLLSGLVCAGAFLLSGCAAHKLSNAILCIGARKRNIAGAAKARHDSAEEGFGMGDVKLIFALGMLLGMRAGLTAVMMAALCCGAAAGGMTLAGRVDRTATLPFGPYLCTAAAATLVFLA